MPHLSTIPLIDYYRFWMAGDFWFHTTATCHACLCHRPVHLFYRSHLPYRFTCAHPTLFHCLPFNPTPTLVIAGRILLITDGRHLLIIHACLPDWFTTLGYLCVLPLHAFSLLFCVPGFGRLCSAVPFPRLRTTLCLPDQLLGLCSRACRTARTDRFLFPLCLTFSTVETCGFVPPPLPAL